jgi:HEAT repeat protein
VVIRRSSTREVQDLVADIVSDNPDGIDLRREAAVARLRVIGDRAMRQVAAALDAAPPAAARIALLRVLDGRHDTLTAEAVARALEDPDSDVRATAIAVARGVIDEAGGSDLLGRLTSIAVDGSESSVVRRAAIGVLTTLPGTSARPVLEQLASDPDPSIRLAAAPRTKDVGDEPGAEIEDAASGALPADPHRILDALARDAAIVPLPTLHRLVAVLRTREGDERRDAGRRDWLTVRGAVHQALASRESRVALYDAREALEGAEGPLPPGFLDALAAMGDAACLETIAVKHAAEADRAWRAALAEAASAIAKRQRLTPRSAVVKRLRAKYGEDSANRLLGWS